MTADDDRISAWLHGALDSEEATRMEALAASDPDFARRADELRQLDALVRQAVPLEDPLPAELLSRLGLSATAPAEAGNIVDLAAARAARIESIPAAPARFVGFASSGWRIAAQVLLVLGIGLGAMQWIGAPQRDVPDAAYRTLSDAPSAAASANALVMFDAGIDEKAAKEIVARAGAQIVGTATAAGAWRLSIDPAQRDAVLHRLGAHPQVRMAQPIEEPGQ